jgi:tetratricopeptide (TPR) repeat protein
MTDPNFDDNDDNDIAFTSVDFSGVSFDDVKSQGELGSSSEPLALNDFAVSTAGISLLDKIYSALAFQEDRELQQNSLEDNVLSQSTRDSITWLLQGDYVAILRAAMLPKMRFNNHISLSHQLRDWIRLHHQQSQPAIESSLQQSLVGVAALNLYLQLNYTGPSLQQIAKARHEQKNKDDEDSYQDILYPFEIFGENQMNNDCKNSFHNAVLSELVVDGEWPHQVCQVPFWLLVARILLKDTTHTTVPAGLQVWSLRAAVSHARLLVHSAQPTLWQEIKSGFQKVLIHYCSPVEETSSLAERHRAATVVLEWGLAQHFLDRPGKGRLAFHKAKHYSGLMVELTGTPGKRTKYQKFVLAQMQVKATSIVQSETENLISSTTDNQQEDVQIKAQAVQHAEDGILLEKVRFENEGDNQVTILSILDQAILLALCLDVKNTNPSNDGLTAEEMGAYLGRVLDQSNDWMVYATALLERAWLEYASSHARERSLLQLQALADQHTNRLTLTQSTFDAVQNSAPVQQRLKHLHTIVYPPRWDMLQDLAERYASMGIVTSAAELFQEIQLWDQVVECYKRAGKQVLAEEIVRSRLEKEETPRMWSALGDLTNDPQHHLKALALSKGRFTTAWVALGKYDFDHGNLRASAEHYRKALALRPLMPAIWFRVGTISMQLEDWETALEAFSQVVQQEPEESDAWANVAAVHMHNRQPQQAYPALVESLKYSRSNWRVWTSKLYVCIDLKKYDEAIQACQVLLDLQQSQSSVPPLEAKCVKALVGACVKLPSQQNDESSHRTQSRLYELLDRQSRQPSAEAWVWDCLAIFQEHLSDNDEALLETLLKEHRALQAVEGWEKDGAQIRKVVSVVSRVSHLYMAKGDAESLIKCRYLVRGVYNKIKAVYVEEGSFPNDAARLVEIQAQLEDMSNKLKEPRRNDTC